MRVCICCYLLAFIIEIHEGVLAKVREKVVSIEDQLHTRFIHVITLAKYAPDYLSLRSRDLLLRFYAKNRNLSQSHFDACILPAPLIKSKPGTERYLELLLELQDLQPPGIRQCITRSFEYHQALDVHLQQPYAGNLEWVHGPRFVYFNITTEVLWDLWRSPTPIGLHALFELNGRPSPIQAAEVTAVTLPIQNRLMTWTRSLSELGLYQAGFRFSKKTNEWVDLHAVKSPNALSLAEYGVSWYTRRMLVFLDIRLCNATFFDIALSTANVIGRGNFKPGGAGVLKYTIKKKDLRIVKSLYLRVLMRRLSRTTPDTLTTQYNLQHRHVGDLSMFLCIFSDIIVSAVDNDGLSLDDISQYVSDASNMMGSASRMAPSDDPKWASSKS